MSKINVVTFTDHIGRVVIGEQVESNKDTLKVKNPAIIHIGQNPQTGQIQVQTLPYFFREFLEPTSATKGTVWKFNRDKIVEGELTLDERLVSQYEKLFSNVSVQVPNTPANAKTAGAAGNKAEVIKLFDDEDDKK